MTTTDARRANFSKSKVFKNKNKKLDARKANFTNSVFTWIDIKNSKFWAADFRFIAIKDGIYKFRASRCKFNKESIIKNLSF